MLFVYNVIRVTFASSFPFSLLLCLDALYFLSDAGCQNDPALPGHFHAKKPRDYGVLKCGREAQTEGYRLGNRVFLLLSLSFSLALGIKSRPS